MNASNILNEQAHASDHGAMIAVAMLDARDSAHRALFSAASRVLRYHAAALDAKVARIMETADGITAPSLGTSQANG